MSTSVALYRVVSSAELFDLRSTGAFRTTPGHMDSRPARSVDETELAWFNGCVVEIVLPETEALDG